MNAILRTAAMLDAGFYQRHYPDLAAFSPEQARAHYEQHGRAEGRTFAAGATRETVGLLLPEDGPLLEIGAAGEPMMQGPRVRHAVRHGAPAEDGTGTEEDAVDYDLSRMRLRDVPERFAAAVSSRCVEHQPDLVRHLNEVAAILEKGAPYVVLIPDKRYCFDHFRPLSTTVDVVAAHIDRREVVETRAILAQLALGTHNDTQRHWAGDHGAPAALADHALWRQAAASLQGRGPGPVDAHVWQFTPESFAAIADDLLRMGLLGLVVETVFETPARHHEFCAVFRRHY